MIEYQLEEEWVERINKLEDELDKIKVCRECNYYSCICRFRMVKVLICAVFEGAVFSGLMALSFVFLLGVRTWEWGVYIFRYLLSL